MTYNAGAVYVFPSQLLIHLQKNHGPSPIKVLHWFSDNCAVQYICIEAFTHLALLEDAHSVKVYYHNTEAGHAKGPSDGLGEATKKKLDRLVVLLQVYLSLVQNECHVLKEPSFPIMQMELAKSRSAFEAIQVYYPYTELHYHSSFHS